MTGTSPSDGQTFTLAEVHELYQSAYEDGVAAGYLQGERDGHDRALAEYLAELPVDAFGPRLPWVTGQELRSRLAATQTSNVAGGSISSNSGRQVDAEVEVTNRCRLPG